MTERQTGESNPVQIARRIVSRHEFTIMRAVAISRGIDVYGIQNEGQDYAYSNSPSAKSRIIINEGVVPEGHVLTMVISPTAGLNSFLREVKDIKENRYLD